MAASAIAPLGSSTILNSSKAMRIAVRTVSSSTVMPRETRCAAASNGTAPAGRGVGTVRSEGDVGDVRQ